METTGVRQELLGENMRFCVSQSYMDSVHKKRPPRKRDKTKAPPESKADLFWKESYNWKRKPNLFHEIELQIIKVSVWNGGQDTDSAKKKKSW